MSLLVDQAVAKVVDTCTNKKFEQGSWSSVPLKYTSTRCDQRHLVQCTAQTWFQAELFAGSFFKSSEQ